jgi:hypothetical protein
VVRIAIWRKWRKVGYKEKKEEEMKYNREIRKRKMRKNQIEKKQMMMIKAA